MSPAEIIARAMRLDVFSEVGFDRPEWRSLRLAQRSREIKLAELAIAALEAEGFVVVPKEGYRDLTAADTVVSDLWPPHARPR